MQYHEVSFDHKDVNEETKSKKVELEFVESSLGNSIEAKISGNSRNFKELNNN